MGPGEGLTSGVRGEGLISRVGGRVLSGAGEGLINGAGGRGYKWGRERGK